MSVGPSVAVLMETSLKMSLKLTDEVIGHAVLGVHIEGPEDCLNCGLPCCLGDLKINS